MASLFSSHFGSSNENNPLVSREVAPIRGNFLTICTYSFSIGGDSLKEVTPPKAIVVVVSFVPVATATVVGFTTPGRNKASLGKLKASSHNNMQASWTEFGQEEK